MAERRKSGKRKTAPAREAKRLSLLDLPPVPSQAVDAVGDRPTNPRQVVRTERKQTLLPAPAEPMDDVSLESLARLAHRASGVPLERAPTVRQLKPYVAREEPAAAHERAPSSSRAPEVAARPEPVTHPTEPSPPPDFGRASSLPPMGSFRPSSVPPAESFRPSALPPSEVRRPSSLPPPIQMPSEAPRPRRRSDGGAWLRTLGIIVLSATVGAVVSSALWGVKSELAAAAAKRGMGVENTEKAAMAPAANCTTAAPAGTVNAAPLVPATTLASMPTNEAPRISFDALPRQGSPNRPDERRGVAAEHVSLEGPPSERASRTESRSSRRRDTRDSESPRASREHRAAAAPAELPDQPSRASINQAVTRSSSAATSCDTSPQDGKVAVTFAPSGAVQSVSLVKGFGDAAVNGCVLRAFGRARVPAFSGDPVVVKKTIAW